MKKSALLLSTFLLLNTIQSLCSPDFSDLSTPAPTPTNEAAEQMIEAAHVVKEMQSDNVTDWGDSNFILLSQLEIAARTADYQSGLDLIRQMNLDTRNSADFLLEVIRDENPDIKATTESLLDALPLQEQQ